MLRLESSLKELNWKANLPKIGLAWIWFFLVLLSSYSLKPLRDGLGSSLVGYLPTLYTLTFVGTIGLLFAYTRLVAVFPRKTFLFIASQFIAALLLLFYAAFASDLEDTLWISGAFFVCTSVLNVFTPVMFWSVMAELFSSAQGKAWFGILAAAGSLGSISSSILAVQLTNRFGTNALILVAIIATEITVAVAIGLLYLSERKSKTGVASASIQNATPTHQAIGGSIWEGFRSVLRSRYLILFCLFILFGKFCATFIYNNLQDVLNVQMPDKTVRTALFAEMNIYSQTGSFLVQALVAGLVMSRLGVTAALLIPTACIAACFGWLIASPTLFVLIASQIGQQILSYGLITPAQQVLFTVVSVEEKYKTKAFTDTLVFRGSDVLSANLTSLLLRTGLNLGKITAIVMPLALVWCWVAYMTGREYRRKADANREKA